MSTKKFIISISCALCVLVLLCVVAISLVNRNSHHTALLGTWNDLNEEDKIAVSITFKPDDTYEKTTLDASEGEPKITTEEGTFSIFSGKITLTSTEGDKDVITYEYDKIKKELTLGNPAEYSKLS